MLVVLCEFLGDAKYHVITTVSHAAQGWLVYRYCTYSRPGPSIQNGSASSSSSLFFLTNKGAELSNGWWQQLVVRGDFTEQQWRRIL